MDRIDPETRRQAVRFVLVGATVAGIYTALLTVLYKVVGLPFQAALALAYFTAVGAHFTMHRTFTFLTERGYAMRTRDQLARYLALVLLQYALTAAALAVLPDLLDAPRLAVWFCTVSVFALVSFIVLKTKTFHAAGAR